MPQHLDHPHVTRRTILKTASSALIAGVGLSALAACSSSNSTNSSAGSNGNQAGALPGSNSSNPHGYTDDGHNHSGRIEFENFESGEPYEPGTAEYPPRNAPKPKMPQEASENTVAGFYATVSYYAAAMDYLVKTGSLESVKEVKIADQDASDNEALALSISEGIRNKTWYVDPSAWYELKASQPAIMSDGNLLFKSIYTLDYGAESVTNGEIQPVKEEERVSTQDCDFRGRYNPSTKSWELNLSYGPKASANASPNPADSEATATPQDTAPAESADTAEPDSAATQ